MPTPLARSCRRFADKRSRAAAGALAVAALLGPLWLAGTPAGDAPNESAPARREGPSLLEHEKVRLSLIEVVAVDRRGRHVRGIPPSEFHLFEGKREVPIVSVDEVDLSAPPVAAPPTPPPVPGKPVTGKAEVGSRVPGAPNIEAIARNRRNGPRWFLLLIDGYNNPSPLRISQMRRAAKNWLRENLRPQDMAAVYELTPYLHSLVGFTRDTYELVEAMDHVHVFPASSMGTEFMRQRLQQGGLMSRQALEEQLLNASRFGNDLLSAERDQFYVNVHDVAGVMQGLKGTKTVLLFSGGFPLTRNRYNAARGGFTTRFRDMLEALQQTGIRVFTFDVGEEGAFTDAEEATNNRQMVDQLGLGTEWLDTMQIGAQMSGVNAHQEILGVLGAETGGRFFAGHNYAAALRTALDDLTHYYLVGYRPRDVSVKKKGFTPLKVRIERSGVHAIAPRGRLLIPTAAELTGRSEPAGVPEPAAVGEGASGSSPGDRAENAEAKTGVPPEAAPPAPLRLSCVPIFYPGPGGKTLVAFAVKVAGPVKPQEVGAEESVLDLDLDVTARAAGEEIATGNRTVRLRLRPEAAGPLEAGLILRDGIVLPPAALDLSVRVRLNGQDRSGDWSELVEVPSFQDATFDLTGIALFSLAERAPVLFDAFQGAQPIHGTEPRITLPDPCGDAAGRPSPYFDSPFPRSLPLLVQVGVTGPPPRPEGEGESPLRLDWELLPEEGGDPLAPPVRYRRLQLKNGGSYLDVLADLDLAEVPEGRYTLRVTAGNRVTGKRAVRTADLVVAR